MSNTVYIVIDDDGIVEGVYSCQVRAREHAEAYSCNCHNRLGCECPTVDEMVLEMVVDES